MECGTLEHFLTERYALFVADAGGTLYRGKIHHRPWQIQEAGAEIAVNTIPNAVEIDLPDSAPTIHYSPGARSLVWPVVPIRRHIHRSEAGGYSLQSR